MLIRLRDILGFVSSQKLAQETATLLKLIACDPYLSEKRRGELDTLTWMSREQLFREADFVTSPVRVMRVEGF